MIQFHSMQTITIWTIVVVIALVWFGSRKQPLAVFASIFRALWQSKPFLIAFISLLLILFVNKYELDIEQLMNISWDFTPVIHQLEGQFVNSFQQLFNHPFLTQFLAFFYLIVFQGLIVSSIGVYTASGKIKMAIAVCYAITINYVIAIPFYLFFPVNEVWSYPPAGVEFVMLQVFPTFEEHYRQFSGLDNCFPSLHTSISVTVALIAARSGIRRWSIFTGISALIIIFSIFYMGIHWLLDMVAGVALATFASWLGMKLAGVEPSIKAMLSERQQPLRPTHKHNVTGSNQTAE